MRGLVIVCLLLGCWRERAKPTPPPIVVDERPPLTVEPKRDSELYAMDEALADVFSGPLEHIGTGPWFGLFRINACAYRNKRVVVVNIYCTTKEMKAFSIIVFSRTRGRVMIYAEADKPISQLTRTDYFTFKGESSPPGDPATLPLLSLDWTYKQLTTWDEKRYYKWIPGCFGGVEIRKPQSGCLKALEAHIERYQKRNQPFFDEPPDAWYRVVREMRARAARDGKFIAHPGG